MLKIKTYKTLEKTEIKFYESSEKLKIPQNKISILVSQSGIGKSYVILNYLMELANKNIRSVYIAAEDEEGEIYNRMKSIFAEKKYDENKIDKNLLILNEIEELTYKDNQNYFFNEKGIELIKLVEGEKINILVIDTLDYIANFDENDNQEATKFIKLWKKEFIRKLKTTIVFIHHLGKIKGKDISDITIDDIRGASSIVSKVRFILSLYKKTIDDKHLYAKVIKSNVGENNKIVKLKNIPDDKKILF